MKDVSRAIRRHHLARLKAVRQKYVSAGGRASPRVLGLVVNTPKLCSCWMCGNPRKHFKQRTRQEHKFELNFES